MITCDTCNSMMIAPKAKSESKWISTTGPFSRIHIDFCFHFEQRLYLLVVDSYSKWVEVELMKYGTDCNRVLKKLVALFARFGLPDVLVSDGGPPFNSHAFVNFLKRQGINVLTGPPYSPSSNGQAERLVRTIKDVLKIGLLDPEFSHLDMEDQINLFLINYRNNCLSIEGKYPSQMIFSYKPKTILDLLNPKTHYKKFLQEQTVHDDLTTSKNSISVRDDIDSKGRGRLQGDLPDPFDNLTPGDELWYKNHNPHCTAKWLKANFTKRLSRNTFQVEIGSARTMAHRGQLRVRKGGDSYEKPNIRLALPLPEIEAVDPEEFRGFTEEEIKRGRKRRMPESPFHDPGKSSFEPRRSKRQRRFNRDRDFIYK